MSNDGARRREEDEMLKFAYVPTTTKKVYATKYRGYVDELPYFFLRDLKDAKDSLRREEVTFETTEGEGLVATRSLTKCKRGQWIVIDGEHTRILSDEQFRREYQTVADLSYE